MVFTVPTFDELQATLASDWTNFKVLAPRSAGKNGIMTGSIVYTKENASGRKVDDQVAFTGPPVTMIPPARDGIVLYPKLTLNLNRQDGKIDEYDPRDAEFAAERDNFRAFVHLLEEQTIAQIKQDPKAFFGKPIAPENIFIKSSFVEAEESNYRTKFTCKVDVTEEARGARESIPWEHIKLDIHDLKVVNQEVEFEKVLLVDISSRDKVLPVFRSVYPYMEVSRNHRNGELEGYAKIQFCLAGLHRIEKNTDLKRLREDEGEERTPTWMSKIQKYVQNTEHVGADQQQLGNHEVSVEA